MGNYAARPALEQGGQGSADPRLAYQHVLFIDKKQMRRGSVSTGPKSLSTYELKGDGLP